MFDRCTSLKELNISGFSIDDDCKIDGMFNFWSNELIEKIKGQNKNLKSY